MGLFTLSMMLAIVKVLPEPVTPKSVCSCAPARIPGVNASIAAGWAPVGLNGETSLNLSTRNPPNAAWNNLQIYFLILFKNENGH